MRTALSMVALALALCFLSATLPLGAQDAPGCDLAKVEKRPWCPGCKAILAAGALDAKGGCAKCGDKSKVEQVDACIKTIYQCPKCKDAAPAAGQCDDCKVARVAVEVAARVIYVCPTCKAKADAPGSCTNAACKGAARVRTCGLSGQFPHVGAK